MARTEGRIKCSIWRDDDFRARSPLAQRAYFLILSQPGVSWCGVIAYRPKPWALLSPGTTAGGLEKSIRELEEHRFVVIDRDTDELWVRTFIYHDGVVDQPKLIMAMAHDFGAIESEPIRQGLAQGLAQRFPEGFLEGLGQRFPKAYEQGFFVGLPEGFTCALAHVRVGGRSPTPNPQPPTPNPLAPAPPSLRGGDALFESVMAVCGIDPADVTASSQGAYAKAVADLRGAGADPDEVPHRAAAYRLRWPKASLTPTALARHWAECHPAGAVLAPVPSQGRAALMRAQARGAS